MTSKARKQLTLHEIAAHSPWIEFPLPRFPSLDRDVEVDVVVVGGGLTGITVAYLLRREGARVALIERDRIASTDTARTTAHLTYVTDKRLRDLVRTFGRDGAHAFWDAGALAIEEIERLARETRAECEFRRVPGYLHAPVGGRDKNEREHLEEDATLASELGFDAAFVDRVPLVATAGVRFDDQAKFHPRRYLSALAQAFADDGGHIFEQTDFEEAEENPMRVRANGRTIRCDYLVIATHNPLMGKKGVVSATLFQTKLALYTSYVLGARIEGPVPEALFWDTSDPYNYLRIDQHEDHAYAIFGGEDVKTGQEKDGREPFLEVDTRMRQILPQAQVTHRWMGQVVETDDGLPFIGENADREFIATGFCGNGFTLGTLAAMMARDRYVGRPNPWFDLFRVDRKQFHGGVWRYVRENLDFPYHFVRDRMRKAEGDALESLGKGQGAILDLDGDKVAAYRDEKGQIAVLSPVCTHLKCLVRWNAADSTWDCPCHGSRFRATGEVLSGPAEAPLARIEREVKASPKQQ